ncbi:MAG: ABC transporter ATP-binding protein, partial [Bacilli bacterium]|nr:ABC transporter ATP-binding protein [Bacilli bacterium]
FYPILTRKVFNDFVPNNNNKAIWISGAILLILYFIRMLLKFFVQYYGHVIGVKMQAKMRSDMFEHLQNLPYSYYDEHETGKIMSRMTNDLNNVAELAHHGPENIFISGAMLIGSFIYLCTINFRLTMIIFCCAPVLVVVSIIMRKRMRDAFMESRKSIAVINGALESSISGIRVTKAFTNSDKELEKFENGNDMYVEARRKSYKAMGQFGSSTAFVTDFFNCVIFIAGGIFIASTNPNLHITAGDYMAFIVSIGLFISPINMLIGFVEQLQEGATGFKRFVEVMDENEELDPAGAKELVVTKGEIEFKNVNFSYNENKQILFNVSLHIESGKKLALVGPSGGGKTTICHLIPNFYRVEDGEILIDGQNINEVSLESLRRNIGIVQQDVFLFNGTIKENILYGRLDATDEEVYEAAKKANIHDYVISLPDGYDTEIGERGVKLSGGQKQRLSIARVFLKDPAILILDEATSSLDNTTEILIQAALDELCKGRTTLVVAHRLSTIKNADEICVIGAGEIREQGTHEELMALDGIYAKLYSLQFRPSEIVKLNPDLIGEDI